MHLDADDLRGHLEPLFQENFEKFGELGAAISVWQNGKELTELHGGFRDARSEQAWDETTIVLIWSATKGLGSACLLHVLQERKIDVQRRVGEFWLEFAQAGKEKITLAQLLSHQAGLAALDRKVDVLDYEAVIDALEKQEPNWRPGTGHGYHARTFGFLLDELVRRISGTRLGEYWRKTFAGPLGLDLWIGLPERENARVATIYAPKADKRPKPQQFYAMLANAGRIDDQQFFFEKTINWMTTTLTDGIDRVFQIPTAFSAGLMKDSRGSARNIFGRSTSSFGHPGAGGSHAFADPENKISFAYVMNQMEQSVLPSEKSLRLVDAIYE